MYRIAICEDQLSQQNYLTKLLNQISINYDLSFHIDCFSSGELFLNQPYQDYDLIILDIQMGHIDGITTAKQIRQTNTNVKIIFVTACEHYWPEGYLVNAYRFIIKPVDPQKFTAEIVNVFEEIEKSKDFLVLKLSDTVQKIRLDHIIYLEIIDRKVIFHTTHGDFTSYLSLNHWNEQLIPKGFANPHKSYLINLKYVTTVSKEEVTLSTGEIVYVSQRKYKTFKEAFINYVSSF